MSDEQMNSYRLTSMEAHGDERMAQIMREVAEDARVTIGEKDALQNTRAIFETVMPTTDKVDYILRAKVAGFFICLFFVFSESPTINAKRYNNRPLMIRHN